MSVISAGTTLTTALVQTGDTNGNLVFKTGASGTTALTLGSDQSATFAGAVSFSGGISGNINFDSGTLFIDGANNRVGVGSTTPASRLTVEGTNGTIGSQIQLVGSGVLSGYIGPSADGLNFGTDSGGLVFRTGVTGNGSVTTGSERMRIDSSGNVGIGTSSPSELLSLRKGNAGIRLDGAGTAASSVWIDYYVPNNGGVSTSSNFAGRVYAVSSGTTDFSDNSIRIAVPVGGSATPVDTLIVKGGNVGIGTSSPSSYNASARNLVIASSSTSAGMTIRAGGGGASNIIFSNAEDGNVDGLLQYDTGSNFMRFDTNGSERMRIDSSGNVGIGTSSPSYAIDIIRDANSFQGLRARNNNSGSSADAGVLLNAFGNSWAIACGSSAKNSNALTFTVDPLGTPTERMRIDTSGRWMLGTTSPSSRATIAFSSSTGGLTITTTDDNALYCQYLRSGVTFVDHKISGSTYQIVNFSAGVSLAASGTSWGSLSDERQKDIIEPITNATEKVASLRAVIGKYKTDNPEKRRAFLIAQDVQAVLPEAVYQNSDEDDTLNLAYTDTIPLLVAAIKEQQAIINDLTTRLTALENK